MQTDDVPGYWSCLVSIHTPIPILSRKQKSHEQCLTFFHWRQKIH
jgi:hypothetical protein